MAVTDIITLFLSFVFLLRGFSRGFMGSLIGPLSVIAATAASIIYYQMTRNVMISLIIGLAGPLFLSVTGNYLIKTIFKLSDEAPKPNFLSSLGGGMITLAWGWTFIIFALLILSLLPPIGKPMSLAHDDLLRSGSYQRVARPVESLFFAGSHEQEASIANNTLRNDTQTLAQDPRFQKVLADPEIQGEIKAHDYVKLMSNPKMMALTQQIMNDPAAMQKILTLYKSQSQTQDLASK